MRQALALLLFVAACVDQPNDSTQPIATARLLCVDTIPYYTTQATGDITAERNSLQLVVYLGSACFTEGFVLLQLTQGSDVVEAPGQ
jgi:hypothetical protein